MEIEFNEREPGVYPMTFTGLEEFEYTDKASNEIEHRWRWIFVDDQEQTEDTLTSRSFKPGTNGLRFLTGILGRPPKKGDKPADKFGTTVNVLFGPNRNGKLTITDILPYKAGK